MPIIYLFVDDELNIIRKNKFTNNLLIRIAIIDINQYQDWAKEKNNEHSFNKILELFQNNKTNIETKVIKSMNLDFNFNFNTGTYSFPKLEITYENNVGKYTLEGESVIYNFLIHNKY